MVYIKNDQQFQVIVKKGLQKVLLAFQNEKAFWHRIPSLVRKTGKGLFLTLSGLTDLPDLILVLVLGPELQVIYSNDS